VAVKFEYAPGATPIDADEAAGLIPSHLTLQRELNEYEEVNILQAVDWLFGRRRGDPLDPRFIHTVLRRMFDQTWEWAGRDRRPLSSSSGFHPRISERQWSPCPIDGRSALDGSCGSSFRMGSSITHVGR